MHEGVNRTGSKERRGNGASMERSGPATKRSTSYKQVLLLRALLLAGEQSSNTEPMETFSVPHRTGPLFVP